MKTVLRFATIFGLMMSAAVVGVIASACNGGGGGGTLTLEEFFAEVEALDNAFEVRSDQLTTTVEGLSAEALLEQAPDLFGQQAELIGEFVDGLSELDPPDEAAELHDEAVSAGRDLIATFNDLIGGVEAAESVDEVFALFEDAEFNAAINRFDQVCLDAEQLAADHGITIDLNCEEAGEEAGAAGFEIAAVFPEEGSAACPETRIVVTLGFLGSRSEWDAVDFSLTLDGADLEEEGTPSHLLSTETAESAEIVYQDAPPLSLGQHEVSVSFPGEAGQRQTDSWTFQVDAVPCRES